MILDWRIFSRPRTPPAITPSVLFFGIFITYQVRNVQETSFPGTYINKCRLNARKHGVHTSQEDAPNDPVLVGAFQQNLYELVIFK
jgi:hypothetical protein